MRRKSHWARRLTEILVATVAGAALIACADEPGERTPTGAPTDPVETCERVGDVCRIDDARLGVCEARRASAAEGTCEGDGCFACAPQH